MGSWFCLPMAGTVGFAPGYDIYAGPFTVNDAYATSPYGTAELGACHWTFIDVGP